MKRKVFYVISALFTLCTAIAMCIWPSSAADAARNAVNLCLSSVIPSLFPFFVLSSLIVRLGIANTLGKYLAFIMRPLFGVSGNGAAALLIGLIGGYPSGVRTVCELYECGEIQKGEAESLLGFCNNCGPAFILGIAAGVVFKCGSAIFLLPHIAGAIITGMLMRSKSSRVSPVQKKAPSPVRKPFFVCFCESVKSSVASILNVCGFVIFFSVISGLLNASGAAELLGDKGSILLRGILEITGGVLSLGQSPFSQNASIVLCSFFLAWGGISVMFQSLSLSSEYNLNPKKLIFGKIIHACTSAAITAAFLPFSSPVSAQFLPCAALFDTKLILLSLAILLIFFVFLTITAKNNSKSKTDKL